MDKNLGNENQFKKINLKKDLNKEPFKIDSFKSFISVIDNKNIHEIENFSKNINKNDNDIIYELYNKNILTVVRLQFTMEYCTYYLNISSNLIKRLMKDENVSLLDIIFSKLKFYNNEFIV